MKKPPEVDGCMLAHQKPSLNQTLLSGFEPVTALPPESAKSLCPTSAAAATRCARDQEQQDASRERAPEARDERVHASPHRRGSVGTSGPSSRRVAQAPLRLKTATTVHHMIFRSSPSEARCRYSTSSRRRSSKVAALRSLTCHRPVIPGTASSRSVCHRS